VVLTSSNHGLYQSVMKDYSLRQEMLGYVTTSPCSFVTPSKTQKEQGCRTQENQKTLQREDKRGRRNQVSHGKPRILPVAHVTHETNIIV
jgi:hypothetical protein